MKILTACWVLWAAGLDRAAPPAATEADGRMVREALQILADLVAVDTVGGNETTALAPLVERFRAAGSRSSSSSRPRAAGTSSRGAGATEERVLSSSGPTSTSSR